MLVDADRDNKPWRPRGLNVEILWITQAPTPPNSQHSPQMIFVGFYWEFYYGNQTLEMNKLI